MVSGISNALLNLAGWSFVPDFATGQILRFLNPLLSNYFGIPVPARGTPQFALRYRLTLSFVVFSYLLYSLIQGSQSIAPNFYEILGVNVDVDETGLKAAFKGFAKRYHPDRPNVGQDGTELFMKIRAMFEALKDPVVRFAYDRFGPEVLAWEGLSTEREYLRHGLIYNSGYHIVTFLALQFWSAIGEPSPVAFWRNLLYVALFVVEYALLLSPSPSTSSVSAFFSSTSQDPTISLPQRSLLHVIFPQRVAYQHIIFLHHLFLFLSVGLGRVAPQLFPGDPPAKFGQALIERLNAVVSAADRETAILLHTDVHSIHPLPSSGEAERPTLSKMQPKTNLDPKIMEVLSKEMRDMIIETNVKKDTGPIARAWKDAIARGRTALRFSSSSIPPESAAVVIPGEGNTLNVNLESVTGEGELPSPRPSPPPTTTPLRPSLQRRGSNYVRARSVTC